MGRGGCYETGWDRQGRAGKGREGQGKEGRAGREGREATGKGAPIGRKVGGGRCGVCQGTSRVGWVRRIQSCKCNEQMANQPLAAYESVRATHLYEPVAACAANARFSREFQKLRNIICHLSLELNNERQNGENLYSLQHEILSKPRKTRREDKIDANTRRNPAVHSLNLLVIIKLFSKAKSTDTEYQVHGRHRRTRHRSPVVAGIGHGLSLQNLSCRPRRAGSGPPAKARTKLPTYTTNKPFFAHS